jgi:hypothetical protein
LQVKPRGDAPPDGIQPTIPVPFSFAAMLSEKVRDNNQAVNFAIYSKYPFPGRTHDLDAWRRNALAQLTDRTEDDASVQEIVTVDDHGRQVRQLRYAEVIRMTSQSCCDCHNNFSETWGGKKTGWNGKTWSLGEVRGVIEVTRKVD